MTRFKFNHKPTFQLIPLLLVTMLSACQSSPDAPVEANKALDQAIETNTKNKAPKKLRKLPKSVQQELREQHLYHARNELLAEKRLEISANNVKAQEFFPAMMQGSSYSVAVHPDVDGEITLNLKAVTLSEALTVLEDLYGYDIRRTGKVIQVYPAGMRTETIPLDYLFIKRMGASSTSINSGGVSEQENGVNGNSNGSNGQFGGQNNQNIQNGQMGQTGASGINIYTENNSDFWEELKETLTALIGEENGRTILISPQAGLITVRALPSEIKAVKDFLNTTQSNLHRQVIIEAKIMEVTLNDDYQQGVKWDQVLGHIGSTDLTFSSAGNIAGNTISATIGGTSALSFLNSDFAGVINLLSSQGNVQVLSSPRITATNNQKAVIKVGEDEYFVTDVSSTTTTGTATTTIPEVELTPFFSGIALDVTPQIDTNGEVILHVHPSVTVTDEQTKNIRLGDDNYALPLAQSSVRESDTIVRAKSGEIIIIGGLIETTKVDLDSKTPLFGSIPLLGELFKSKSQSTQKKELVIMLKPVVVGQDTWKNQLHDARNLLEEWFPED